MCLSFARETVRGFLGCSSACDAPPSKAEEVELELYLTCLLSADELVLLMAEFFTDELVVAVVFFVDDAPLFEDDPPDCFFPPPDCYCCCVDVPDTLAVNVDDPVAVAPLPLPTFPTAEVHCHFKSLFILLMLLS